MSENDSVAGPAVEKTGPGSPYRYNAELDEALRTRVDPSCECKGTGQVVIFYRHVMIPTPLDPGGPVYGDCPRCKRS